MADHLPAGRVRDAEIAIQEEVAQATPGEFGIARLDVGKFAEDGVLIHLDASIVLGMCLFLDAFLWMQSRQPAASNFLAAGIAVLAAPPVPCENHASRVATRQF
jgi:hypothetical protein